MRFTVSILFIFGSLLLLSSCGNHSKYEQYKEELIQVDKEFASLSVAKGSHSAFLHYIDDSCVLLRPKKMPVVGRRNIEEMFSSPDTNFTLNWEPIFADVSESGDLGYTYGIYTVEMDDPEGNTVTKQGTYVTIWKRDPKGGWKFVLDTGNQGIGSKKEENGQQ